VQTRGADERSDISSQKRSASRNDGDAVAQRRNCDGEAEKAWRDGGEVEQMRAEGVIRRLSGIADYAALIRPTRLPAQSAESLSVTNF